MTNSQMYPQYLELPVVPGVTVIFCKGADQAAASGLSSGNSKASLTVLVLEYHMRYAFQFGLSADPFVSERLPRAPKQSEIRYLLT